MSEEPLPSSDEYKSNINSFAPSPERYVLDEVGQTILESEVPEFEFGPAKLERPMFVCPDCNEEGDVELHAHFGSDVGDDEATIRCPNCDFSRTQTIREDIDK